MKNSEQLGRRDLERISAYIDGMLSRKQSARLEARLASDPGLQRALEDLRATRLMLRQLPSRKAPRSFALTPEMVGITARRPSTPVLQMATAIATLVFFSTIGLGLLGGSPAPAAMEMALAPPEAMLMADELAETGLPTDEGVAEMAAAAEPLESAAGTEAPPETLGDAPQLTEPGEAALRAMGEESGTPAAEPGCAVEKVSDETPGACEEPLAAESEAPALDELEGEHETSAVEPLRPPWLLGAAQAASGMLAAVLLILTVRARRRSA